MREAILLDPSEIVPGRPFANPENIDHDLETLRYMLYQLCLLLEYPYLPGESPRTVLFQNEGTSEWFHRLVLAQPDGIWASAALVIVGFFGSRRDDANVALAHEFDRLLVSEIPEYPGLCTYSTMALSGGNYGNLVVFTDRNSRNHWSTSQAHVQAVNSLSPNYYSTVTIYNGLLPKGLLDRDALHVTRAKYFDYQCEPRWEAVREIG
jgi:hypothetical protein